jgi:small subunit ribosomal protein S19
MSRSIKKGPFIEPKLLIKVQKAKSGQLKEIKTWSRDSVIFPEMIGLNFLVHNGKNFISVIPSENMVGHKLGEFALTRKFQRHGGKMAKDQAAAVVDAEKKQMEAAKAPADKK